MALEDALYPLLKRYIGAPDWVKNSIGRAYSWMPESLRVGPAAQQFRAELADPRADAIGRRAADKLMATLHWSCETVPAYRGFRRLLAQTDNPREILARLPVTGKDELKRDVRRYVSEAMPPSQRLRMFTGGSTANPMEFYLQRNVSRSREYAYMEAFRARIGANAGNIVLALRGRTVPTASIPGGKLWMYEPIKKQLIFSSDHLEERYMPRYAEALERLRPTVIEAFPSALYPLARWLDSNPALHFVEHLKGVMLFSENAYEFQLRLFRKVFRCPVLTHYGHSERVLMAASMPDDDCYFFWPLYGHFELLNAAGEAVTQPGELGEIVGTGFDNKVMPFIRYRTGDFAVLSDTPHPELTGYPVCERIEGRLQEFLVCRDQRLISITTMGAAHFEQLAAVQELQYEQDQPGLITLKVVSADNLKPDVIAEITRAVTEKTQGGCVVRVRRVERIERTGRGKHRMLLQHIDLGRYFGAGRPV
jgi:phenylacetate-CoA ligase